MRLIFPRLPKPALTRVILLSLPKHAPSEGICSDWSASSGELLTSACSCAYTFWTKALLSLA